LKASQDSSRLKKRVGDPASDFDPFLGDNVVHGRSPSRRLYIETLHLS